MKAFITAHRYEGLYYAELHVIHGTESRRIESTLYTTWQEAVESMRKQATRLMIEVFWAPHRWDA